MFLGNSNGIAKEICICFVLSIMLEICNSHSLNVHTLVIKLLKSFAQRLKCLFFLIKSLKFLLFF